MSVLTESEIAKAINVIQNVTEHLLRRIVEGLVSEEPAMVGELAAGLDCEAALGRGLRVRCRVLDAAGKSSSEHLLGADIVGVVRLEVDGTSINKGFLAQVKRSKRDGLHFRPPVNLNDFSHRTSRGVGVQLDRSGTVSVSRPSKLLATQCQQMLKVTPAAFVWVIADEQIAVVSAGAVSAAYSYPKGRKRKSDLGTKRLDDFWIHLLDCFFGDPALQAWDTSSLLALCQSRHSRYGLLVEVTDTDS